MKKSLGASPCDPPASNTFYQRSVEFPPGPTTNILMTPRSGRSIARSESTEQATSSRHQAKPLISPGASTADLKSVPDTSELVWSLPTPSASPYSPAPNLPAIDLFLVVDRANDFGDEYDTLYSSPGYDSVMSRQSGDLPAGPYDSDPLLELDDLSGFWPVNPAPESVEADGMLFNETSRSRKPAVDPFQHANGLVQDREGSPHVMMDVNWLSTLAQVDHAKDKVRHLTHVNPLAMHLTTMDTVDIIDVGILTTARMKDGARSATPLDCLCMAQIAFALGHIVYGRDTERQERELFTQIIAYTTQMGPIDRQFYVDVVDVLWRPEGWSRAYVDIMVQQHAFETVLSSGSGLQRNMPGSYATQEDKAITVLLYSVDGFEHLVIKSADKPFFQASALVAQHGRVMAMDFHRQAPFIVAAVWVLQRLAQLVADVPLLAERLTQMIHQLEGHEYIVTARRLELQLLHLGRMHLDIARFFGQYVPAIRTHVDSLYAHSADTSAQRSSYQENSTFLMRSILQSVPEQETSMSTPYLPFESLLGSVGDSHGSFTSTAPAPSKHPMPTVHPQSSSVAFGGSPWPDVAPMATDQAHSSVPQPGFEEREAGSSTTGSELRLSPTGSASMRPAEPQSEESGQKVESGHCCPECGYRPKGDPRWFGGSMAKHMKLQHASTPPAVYKCPYPGCTSEFRKRPDNLRQHQIEKNHFVDGQTSAPKRGGKRRKAGSNDTDGIM